MDLNTLFKKKELSLEEQRTQLTKEAYRKKNRSRSFFRRTVVALVLSYGFFFLSPFFLPSTSKGTAFEKNIVYELGEGKEITVVRYDYSVKEKKAELEIDITDKDFIDGTYKIAAKQNSKEKSVKVIIDENFNKIFQIMNVVPDEILKFTIIFTSKSQSGDTTTNNTSISYIPSYLTPVNSLPERDLTGYKIQRVNLEIEDLEQDIKNKENTITDLKNQNATIDSAIFDLETSKSLKTTEEIFDIDEQIKENQEKKKENEQTIVVHQQEIAELQATILDKQKIIKSLTEEGGK